MVNPTRLCLVRHGETDWNAERRLQGHLDIPLNATGEAQACATALSLGGQHFHAAYSSDLLRARQTAGTVAQALGVEIRHEPALRERHYGVFQGLTYDEAQTRHPEAYARFLGRDPHFCFAGDGESLHGFADRIVGALAAIATRHLGQQVLVVTHGGVLDVAHRLASGKPLSAPRDFTIPNAALNWLEYAAGHWKLVTWADRSHLDAARDELPNA